MRHYINIVRGLTEGVKDSPQFIEEPNSSGQGFLRGHLRRTVRRLDDHHRLVETQEFDNPFTEDQIASLPAEVVAKAVELYAQVKSRPMRIGDTATMGRFSIETHTLGCRDAADNIDPDNQWDEHWKIYDEYCNDGASIVAGDAGEGTFVTVTPTL